MVLLLKENTCCFCGADLYIINNNNALPIADSYCCNDCNYNIVIPYRILLSYNKAIKKENKPL